MIWKSCAFTLFLIAWFGFVGPYLVSAPNDIPVLAWFLVTIIGIFFALYKLIQLIRKSI